MTPLNTKVVRRTDVVLYVGLPKNAKDDLGKWRRHFRVARRLVGLNGESAYVWRING